MLRILKNILGHRNPLRLAWHKCKALAAATKYGFPARRLTVVGITGTDGKTTTVGMTAHILRAAGKTVGSLSTAYLRINDEQEWNTTQKTSPSPFVVQKFLRRIADAGCTHAVLEYSSHGLVQGRTLFTWPTVAAITNTAMEHLDYHKTMEQYRKDKSILFRMLKGKGSKVLNADDGTFEAYMKIPSAQTLVYSPNHDLLNVRSEPTGSQAKAMIGDDIFELKLSIPGAFNLENALCAILCAEALGVPMAEGVKHVATFRGTPGRMEKIDEGQPFSVFVDFAITPQAFEKTLTTVRQMVGDKRVLVLTGSCGDRMKEKRPVIGKLCSDMADVVVITDDESYAEDPRKVMEEVWAGVDKAKADAHKIFDRREAIAKILSLAKPGDAVVLCGLGSYPSRMTPSGPIPWNEQEIVRELLRTGSGKI